MLVLGIDEAGRGPVLGSMFIAGALIDENHDHALKNDGVKDSKLVTPANRTRLAKKIRQIAKEIHFVEITAREIDEKRKVMSLNELEALKIAELIESFKKKPEKIIIDAPDPDASNFTRRIKKYTSLKDMQVVSEHKADVHYAPVSAASIIAKTERDKSIRALERKHKVKLGTGYSHDARAIAFLEECSKRDSWPDFVRHSWETSRRVKNAKFQKKIFEF